MIDIGEGEKYLIMMLISFIYGFAMRHFITVPIKYKTRTVFCAHEFSGKDMQYRDDRGLVVWPCCKCGKEFEAKSGLEILQNGKCIGGWHE